MLEPAIRVVIQMLATIAQKCSTFDLELNDDASGAVYKAAIRARVKAALQAADTALQAIINAL